MVRSSSCRNDGSVPMLLSSTFDGARLEKLIQVAQEVIPSMIEGAVTYTIPLALLTFAIGLVLAFFTAIGRLYGGRFVRSLARVYVSIIRGTPLLVQLFVLFYGLPTLGVVIDPFPAAVVGFSLNVGAYASETIRAAIESVPRVQWEAAYALGMTNRQALVRVILPQAVRVAVPPLSNSFIGLVKDTSLASLILVSELFRRAQEVAATSYEFLYIYVLAGGLYWIICFGLSLVQGRVENRFNRHIVGGVSYD